MTYCFFFSLKKQIVVTNTSFFFSTYVLIAMKGFEERAPSHNVDYRQYQNNKGEALVSSYPKTRCSLITETKDSGKCIQ
jgi:hypothetical protein